MIARWSRRVDIIRLLAKIGFLWFLTNGPKGQATGYPKCLASFQQEKGFGVIPGLSHMNPYRIPDKLSARVCIYPAFGHMRFMIFFLNINDG